MGVVWVSMPSTVKPVNVSISQRWVSKWKILLKHVAVTVSMIFDQKNVEK